MMRLIQQCCDDCRDVSDICNPCGDDCDDIPCVSPIPTQLNPEFQDCVARLGAYDEDLGECEYFLDCQDGQFNGQYMRSMFTIHGDCCNFDQNSFYTAQEMYVYQCICEGGESIYRLIGDMQWNQDTCSYLGGMDPGQGGFFVPVEFKHLGNWNWTFSELDLDFYVDPYGPDANLEVGNFMPQDFMNGPNAAQWFDASLSQDLYRYVTDDPNLDGQQAFTIVCN